jgi:hypothetical protein
VRCENGVTTMPFAEEGALRNGEVIGERVPPDRAKAPRKALKQNGAAARASQVDGPGRQKPGERRRHPGEQRDGTRSGNQDRRLERAALESV